MSWRGRDRTCDLLDQSQAFCRLNYPPWVDRAYLAAIGAGPRATITASGPDPATVIAAMGSLIKKRRKRMRKKKHKKMLKRTRFQRRAKGK